MKSVTMIKLPDIISVSLLVISGEYGNGDERKKKLTSEGYDYTKVQGCVNEMLGLIKKYGD